jgi:hypothetical protein
MIAVGVVSLLFVLMGHSVMLHSEQHEPHARHQPHALRSVLGGEFAVGVDHAHLVNGSLTECHDVFATAALPRPATTLVALGFMPAVVAIAAVLASFVLPAGRGPPKALPAGLTGQDLLTRFCLARR